MTKQQIEKLQQAIEDNFRNYSGDWSLHSKNIQFLADLIEANYDDVYYYINERTDEDEN